MTYRGVHLQSSTQTIPHLVLKHEKKMLSLTILRDFPRRAVFFHKENVLISRKYQLPSLCNNEMS